MRNITPGPAAHRQTADVVFFDIGGTLGSPRLSGRDRRLEGLDVYPSAREAAEQLLADGVRLNRNLGRAIGSRRRGHRLGWQVVVDGFKLTPANPSFLDVRDAIVRALQVRQGAGKLPPGADFRAARRAVWEAFARFGMGPGANSIGATLEGLVEDRSLPAGL